MPKNNPAIFVTFPPAPNLGIPQNIKRCLNACSGDYIAFCEGDDYWTDPYKIQKQLEFLESHPDYALCFNALIIYYEEENKYVPHSEPLQIHKDTFTIEDLIDYNYIGNFSCCMYRASIVRKVPPAIFDIFTVDWMFNMACARLGKIGFLKDWMSVYRKHSQGAWSTKSNQDQGSELPPLIDIYNQFFNYEYDTQFRRLKEKIGAWCNFEREQSEKKQAAAASTVGSLVNQQVFLLKRYRELFIKALKKSPQSL